MTSYRRRSMALLPLVAVALTLGGCGAFKGKKAKPHLLGERVEILSGENDIAVEPTLAGVAVTLPPAVANDAWGQPGGNATHAMGNLALGTNMSRAWTAGIAGASTKTRLGAGPVVAGGVLYVMGTDGHVTAFDAATGGRRWSVVFGTVGRDRNNIYGGGVSVDGDIVYATNGLGDVGAMKASDGSVIWKKRMPAPLRGAPSVALGSLYAMSQDNQLFALSTTDGATQWTEAAAVQLAGIFGAAAPAVGQGTVVAGFSSGDLNAYRYENGRVLWQDALSRTSVSTTVGALSDIDADPVIDSGRVFAIGEGGRMVSMELVTGQRLWELNAAGASTPALAGEWLFVVTDDARLLCIARATGKIRWIAQLQHYQKPKSKSGAISWVGPVIAGDRLVLANSAGGVVAVSPDDGHVLAVNRVPGPVFESPIVANNMLYVLDNSGKITAFK